MTGPRRDPDMVRPYVRTGGRVRARADVRPESVLIAATGPTDSLGPDTRRVMRLFAGAEGGLAVADIAAALELPPSTVRILVSSLMDSGHLASPAAASGHQPEPDLLQEVLRGLRSLV
jgi:DNA-binding NarL/FixJ family response regulator